MTGNNVNDSSTSVGRTGRQSSRPIFVLDGGLGTTLADRGEDTSLPLWSANVLINHPAAVLELHKEYVAAGADIITANTFRTSARTFRAAGLPDRSAELTTFAVRLAREAATASPKRAVMVAGSIGPLEDCYKPDLVPGNAELETEHALHASRLAGEGVDLLLCETMGTIREAVAVCIAAGRTGLRTVVNFVCRPDGMLYDGDSLAEALRAVESFAPWAVGINCVSPRVVQKALDILCATTSLPFCIYANVGEPGRESTNVMRCDISPPEYERYAKEWITRGAMIVGGCCGTTPEYVARIRRVVDSMAAFSF